MKCSYCGRQWHEGNECCDSCGAPSKTAKIERLEPFFCDGYIVYALRDWSRDVYEFVFYKGITFMGKVVFTWMEIKQMPPAEDYMPRVMERFNEECVYLI